MSRSAPRTLLARLAVAAAAVLPSLIWLGATQSPAAATEEVQTATFTKAGESTYAIPQGTVSLAVTVVGAAGASVGGNSAQPDGTPGQGAEVTATIAPPSGASTLFVEVGSSGGSSGGGASAFGEAGGGASAIQTCSKTSSSCVDTAVPGTDPRLVVAGGGGGGGENSFNSGTGGNGGNAGASSSVTGPGSGGAGTDSGNGGTGTDAGLGADSSEASAGSGSANCGTAGNGVVGTPGAGGAGGNANNGDSASGGGGGGGWVGGSGGGSGDCPGAATGGSGGGGGAGDSFVESSATASSVQEAGSQAAFVTIAATIDFQPTITSASSTTFAVGTDGFFTVTTTGSPTAALTETGTLPSGVTFTDNNDGTGTLSGVPASGTGGTYAFTIGAANGVGTAASQGFTLTVDQAPAFTSAPSTTFIIGVSTNFTVTTSGYPSASISDGGSTLPAGVGLVSHGDGTATLSFSGSASPPPGVYSFVLIADSGPQSKGAAQSFTLTIDEAPAITSGSSVSFLVGHAGTFTVTTTGFPGGAGITLSEGGATLPSGVTFHDDGDGTATLAGTPAAGTGGTYGFTITAANGVPPNAAQSFTLTVTQPPAITSAAAATFVVGTSRTFDITTTGFPVSALTESGALPGGLAFHDNGNGTATISGTPAASTGGQYSAVVTASNGVSPAATQTIAITVDQSPAFTSAASATFVVGTKGTFDVTVSGFPTPAITYGGTLPSGLAFVDGHHGVATLSGTPKFGSGGVYHLTFGAANGTVPVATQGFTVTVLEAAAFTSPTTARFVLGQPGSFTVTTAAFPSGSAVSISDAGSQLPSGLSFRDNRNGTATISGTPALTSGVLYAVTLTASNGITPAVQHLTLIVGTTPGYILLTKTGGVLALRGSHFAGSLPSRGIVVDNMVGAAETVDGRGYWLVNGVGGVFNFGDARAFGLAGKPLNLPVVGVVPTPDDGGYWLIARDGGVFSYGDARYFGSLPQAGVHLENVIGMVSTLDGRGYDIATSTGGVYAFGDAVPHGGVANPGSAIVGIAADRATGGYWLVSANGSVFGCGARYYGGTPSAGSIIGIAPSADAGGYLLLDRSGTAWPHGDALSAGPLPRGATDSPVVAIASP